MSPVSFSWVPGSSESLVDPWGEPYHYEAPGQQNPHSFDLWSYGADGAPGGEGPDADVGNWEAH